MRRVEGSSGFFDEDFGIELTRSELTILLGKLDQDWSTKMLTHSNEDGNFYVRAVEDEEHGDDALQHYAGDTPEEVLAVSQLRGRLLLSRIEEDYNKRQKGAAQEEKGEAE